MTETCLEPETMGVTAASDGTGGAEAFRRLGLTSAEAERRLAEYGPNKLPEPASPGPLAIFLRQFLSPFIYILLIAASASLLLGQLPNAVFIFAVLVINATIGTVQEYSACRSRRSATTTANST